MATKVPQNACSHRKSSHGGARAGAGRKPKHDSTIVLHESILEEFYLAAEQAERAVTRLCNARRALRDDAIKSIIMREAAA